MYLTRHILTFEALSDTVLPGHLGSLLRGLFGEALYARDKELYEKFFNPKIEQSNPAYKFVTGNPPPPYILRAHKILDCIRRGESFNMTFTLFGDYNEYFSSLQDIWADITTGITNRYGLKLQLIDSKPLLCPVSETTTYDFSAYRKLNPLKNNYTFEFLSPFAFNHNKKLISDFAFSRLYGYIYRRLFILESIYGEKTFIEEYDFADIDNIQPVSIDVRRTTIYRSPERKEKYPMLNWRGKLRYTGDFTRCYGIIKYGEYLHAGSNTVFGFGKYILR